MYAPPRTLTYDTADPHHCAADVYTPLHAGTPRDALVFIHGGAWRSGDKSDHADLPALLADAYARHGETRPLPTLIIPNYRLSAHPAFPDRRAVVHPTHTHDVAAALGTYVTTCADEWDEIEHVVLVGHSCGAHILSHILFTLPRDPPSSSSSSLRPALDHLLARTHAVAFLDGITSVRALAREYPQYRFFLDAAFGFDPDARWPGADAFTDEERAGSRQRSPAATAATTAGLRKTIIAHASADELLTPAQGEWLRDQLDAHGFADVVEWDRTTLQGTHDGCLHDRGVGELLYRLLLA